MFVDHVKMVTLPPEITEWIKEALREHNKNTLQSSEQHYNSLKSQYEKIQKRLSRLFDLRIDCKIDDDLYESKEKEFNNQLIEIKSQMEDIKAPNPNFYEDGLRTFELAERLNYLYDRANNEEKAQLLKLIASNFTLIDGNLHPAYKKPFSFIAEGHLHSKWRAWRDSNPQPTD